MKKKLIVKWFNISKNSFFMCVTKCYLCLEQWYLNNYLIQLSWQPSFSLFLLVKNNGERKRMRESKNITWVWERKLSKSYHKMVVQISFLLCLINLLKIFVHFLLNHICQRNCMWERKKNPIYEFCCLVFLFSSW